MKMEKRNLTCIGCPMGCALLVEMDGKEIISVTGNTCKKGAEYAVKEVTDPTRIVTTTVRVKNGSMPVVSVKTAQDVYKRQVLYYAGNHDDPEPGDHHRKLPDYC